MRRLFWTSVCGLALWGALSACPNTQNQTPDAGLVRECSTRAECAEGKVCTQEGRCAGCQSSGECSLKEACDPEKFLCTWREGWGSECKLNDDCAAGAWCKQGLCVDRSEVSVCPSGVKDECPTGFRCQTTNLVCEEDLGCAQDADCSVGEVCNIGKYECVPRCTAETQATVCSAAEKCVNERCVQCAVDSDCGPGLACDKAGQCVSQPRCYQDRDCQVPLVCFAQTGSCLPKKPPCVTNEDCGLNQRCLVGTGKCVPFNCQPDVYEPNNEPVKAFGVTAKSYTGLTLCANDVDYYSMTLARGDRLGVNVQADPFSENTFNTIVQDGAGRTLASGKLLANFVAALPATYYVSIRSSDSYQTYDISFLRSRGTPCDDDTFEPNDEVSLATRLNTASTAEGVICPQDTDNFSVSVPAGKGLKASLINYNAANGLLRLCVFEAETSLGCSDDTLPQVVVSTLQAAGKTLRVRVIGSSERIANTYTLKVEFP